MAIEKNQIKTSIFLTLLMILTPLAAASTVTTFADGSSEVSIEFKDGVNNYNNTDGGFTVTSDETITSANLNILGDVENYSNSQRVGVKQSGFSWDPLQNNGLTTFGNRSDFRFESSNGVEPLSLLSESLTTDFETDTSEFTNLSQSFNSATNTPVAWEYDQLKFKQLTAGPDTCASGDMCWGTSMFDADYADDIDNGLVGFDQVRFELTTPSFYLPLDLNDTFLRFSSWHALETHLTGTNDFVYPDCAYLEIRTSANGVFGPNDPWNLLQFNIPESSGISPGQGFHIRDDGTFASNYIMSGCEGIPDGIFGLAGTSVSPSNQDGWATVAAQLAQYLGLYAQVRFVLEHTDTPGNQASTNRHGWYVDDFRIGEGYVNSGRIILNNIQPPQTYDDKQPNGYGLLSLDSFVPGDSSLTISVIDPVTSSYVNTPNGQLKSLSGNIIELWGINVDQYPSIRIVLDFQTDQDRVSSPIIHGYDIGSRVGLTFVNKDIVRDFGLTDNESFNFVYDTSESPPQYRYNSSSVISQFSKPIYGIEISGVDPAKCTADAFLSHPYYSNDMILQLDQINYLDTPVFEFTLILELLSDCEIEDIWMDLHFGHHLSGISIDIGDDGIKEWDFVEPGFGSFGFQNQFYGGEFNGQSTGLDNVDIGIDPITRTEIGGFFLLPKGANVTYLNLDFVNNDIFAANQTDIGFDFDIVAGTEELALGTVPYEAGTDFTLSGITTFELTIIEVTNFLLNDPLLPVFKTDDSGIDWMRVGFRVTQDDSNGGKVTLSNLKMVYEYDATMSDNIQLSNYLREYIAVNSQDSSQLSGNQLFVPINTTVANGGSLYLGELNITSQSGYDSTLLWNNDEFGLYATGEIYEVVTTHSVSQSTGSALDEARLRFKYGDESIYLGYDLSTGFYESDSQDDYISLHPSSGSIDLPQNSGKQVTWRFTVNSAWDDQNRVLILSETVATDGVIGMLSGILLEPEIGNAIENDITLQDFTLENTAGVIQNLDDSYSNQEIRIKANITYEDLEISPSPNSFYVVVEKRTIEADGEFANITWIETANKTGLIYGILDWTVDLGAFNVGSNTYRLRIGGYDGGDVICTNAAYNPDSDCGLQFNLTVDILDPQLFTFDLYKLPKGTGDLNSDNNWRSIYDDSWAVPKIQQEFRLIVGDVPNPPDSAVVHVWVEYDHDANSNGLAEADEYIQIPVQSNGQSPNSTYIGEYNDYANSGLKGKVSIWVECYDLAGNSVEGGAAGLDNDLITYVSMQLQYPSINSLTIEDSKGNPLIGTIPSNPPQGVGKWNQTLFAGNQYSLIIDAQDGNGWKDVDVVEIELAPSLTNFDTKIMYFPRNQTTYTESPLFSILQNADGEYLSSIRTIDGNVLLDPFEANFLISIPVIFNWGLAIDENTKFTPTFSIKDIDNSPVFSDQSFRQQWRYANDMALDLRTDLINEIMISPTLVDTDFPISPNLFSINKGSVSGGDVVMFSGQYSFTSGMVEQVFINPETELTLEITRGEVFKDPLNDFDAVDEEITTHAFTGGQFEIGIKLPSFQNIFNYTFRLINLPTGAQDLTTSNCFGSSTQGCGKFSIKVDDEPPEVVYNSWSALRGELSSSDPSTTLLDEMPTSSYHCVDLSVQINERGSLYEEDVSLKWMYFVGNPEDGTTWSVYQNNYGNSPLSTEVNLSKGSGIGYIRATANCVDLWPVGPGQFEVVESDLQNADVKLVIWIDGKDGAGAPIIGGGSYDSNDGSAFGILGSKVEYESTYDLAFESALFQVRNMRTIPEAPEIGDSIKLEVELINTGSIPGVAELEIRSVTNNGVPVFEGYITSQEIGISQSQWVAIGLEEFNDATTGMYYIVYDNETGEVLFNGKDQGKTFNVKVSSSDDSGFSMGLILIILIGVIAILVVVVVVISRRNNDVDFDDLYDDEDDKSYASIPPSQSYSAPAAQVSPEMAEAMEKFTFWTQEEIQGYFDQGWSIQQLEEWLESQ
ncbi:MAG TPA: hypothetical protein HA328_04735 [Candidatus Poseidoniaceae archaeon]|nr:hypothetical protein [Candidatus Poseidoniaceae archaeon]